MSTSQNGWPVLQAGSPLLYDWVVPARNGEVTYRIRNGSAGFLLSYFALWFAEYVQPLRSTPADDWGWAYRPVRGATTGYSNHASGTAIDVNATQHVLGKSGTFSTLQVAKIRDRLRWLRGTIRWGGDYSGRKDEMHFEVNVPLAKAEHLARLLTEVAPNPALGKPHGVFPMVARLLEANPTQKKVIWS